MISFCDEKLMKLFLVLCVNAPKYSTFLEGLQLKLRIEILTQIVAKQFGTFAVIRQIFLLVWLVKWACAGYCQN